MIRVSHVHLLIIALDISQNEINELGIDFSSMFMKCLRLPFQCGDARVR